MLIEALDLRARPEDERDALVQLIGHDIEHPFPPRARAPVGLQRTTNLLRASDGPLARAASLLVGSNPARGTPAIFARAPSR